MGNHCEGHSHSHELPVPETLANSNHPIELARIWAADQKLHTTINAHVWQEPANWGVVLADFANHIADAYASDGAEQEKIVAAIRSAWDKAWQET